jgi:hypothetical protein
MTPKLGQDVYAFCTLPENEAKIYIPEAVGMFKEAEGVTLILLKSAAEKHQIPYIYPCRCLTLSIHSALDAVGFMAAITQVLGASGISVNPISAYYHDHLFVPADRADLALQVLQDMAIKA